MFNRREPHRPSALFRSATSAITAVASLGVVSLMVAAPALAQSSGNVFAYLSAPNKQAAPSSVPNQTVETFDGTSATTGNHTNYSSAIGTYTGTFAVVDSTANGNVQYSAGTGNYFSIGAQSGTNTPVTLTFATPVTYFGLSYNAGDNNNGLTFYDGSGNSIGRYSTATLLTKLNNGQGSVTALDGSSYLTTNYFGRPDGNSPSKTASNQDTSEAFAFLNFFASSGTTISKVVFDNSGSTGTGFESDNHTISTSASNAPPTTGAFVPVGSSSAAPEPGTVALLVLSGLPATYGGMVSARRRRAAKAA